MSDVRFTSDGFVDMEQFPDDGTDLGAAELDALRTTLLADPVEEPTDDQWDAMFDDVVADGETGPFAVDAPADDVATDPAGTDTDTDADTDVDVDADVDTTDLDTTDLDATDDAEATDDLVFHPGEDDATTDDLDLDYDADGGLDLSPSDDGVDDAYSPDALDDGPADIANNDFEDLL
jgi:hypothetical protein